MSNASDISRCTAGLDSKQTGKKYCLTCESCTKSMLITTCELGIPTCELGMDLDHGKTSLCDKSLLLFPLIDQTSLAANNRD